VTRVLITGVSGLLGANLALEASQRYDVVGALHDNALHEPGFDTIHSDLLDPDAVPRMLDEAKADWVINCAAIASLDAAQVQPELTQRLNAEMPGRLATETAKRGLRFVQISSDAVFDGSKGNYEETDAPKPISAYGQSKRMAELAVKSANPQTIIVRPVFFGWSVNAQRSLAEFFYNNLSAGNQVSGFTDRLFCPLHATDLSVILLELLEKNVRGIFHVVSSDHISKYDFGVAVAKRFGLDASLIQPAKTASANPTAPRALDLTLRTGKIAKLIGRRPPSVAAGIDLLHEQFSNGYRDRLLAMAAAPVSEAA
jgi:dTDP-4-dehydrorhamnose reductase